MILDAIEQVGGIYVVTADHGNAEDMVKRDKKGEPLLGKDGKIQILTSHTLQPVSLMSFHLYSNLKYDIKNKCIWKKVTYGDENLRLLIIAGVYGMSVHPFAWSILP